MSEETAAAVSPIDYGQLSEIQVPLEQAGSVFARKDAQGRTPIVLVPLNPHRISNSLLIAGLAILVTGAVAGGLMNNWLWFALGAALGVGIVVFGVYRSFSARIPEATTAMLSRGGQHVKTVGPGAHILPPWFAISHLVTQREIPYDIPAVEALTRDHVRATVDTLITLTISDPARFVYNISADDFDAVLLAACLDTIRGTVRRLATGDIADLTNRETSDLRQTLNAEVEPYGVTIRKISVTDARPPEAFLHSRESRQLAIFHREEQAEKQALAQRRQADAETLAQQQIIAQVERERAELQLQIQQAEIRKRVAELDAETEELRLSNTEARLRKYPQAAHYELELAQLEIARALAGNSKAFLQIGTADDVLRAYVPRRFLQQAMDGEASRVEVSDGSGESVT
ncbi:MAG: SPFH domain-containing protein [Anaerolineae bacterium]|jgi:regulator of protease activity HflC (stomatin/prohibitin superfamily)